jgi:hypothetical protein
MRPVREGAPDQAGAGRDDRGAAQACTARASTNRCGDGRARQPHSAVGEAGLLRDGAELAVVAAASGPDGMKTRVSPSPKAGASRG